MVKFLLKRPIAVLMAFLACTIVGLVTYFFAAGVAAAVYSNTAHHSTDYRRQHRGSRA